MVDVVRTLNSMRKYNLYLTEPQIAALTEISATKGLSVSELIRRALDAFIEVEEEKAQQKSERKQAK